MLSHTWGADNEEFNFKDVTEGTGRNKIGYKKIEFCRAQAASDGLQYFWVNTCCIDKSSSAELSVRRSIRCFAGIKKRTNATYIYPMSQRMRRVQIYGYHRSRGKRYFGRVDGLVEGGHCRN